MKGERSRRVFLSRFQRYLLVSGVMIAAVVVAAGLIVGSFFEREVLQEEEAQTVEVVQNQARQHLTAAHFAAGPVDPAAFAVFLEGLPRVFRIKAFDPSGRIVWSNEPRLIGLNFPDNTYLTRALGGKPTLVLEAPKRAEHVYEQTKRFIAEAYVPVFLPGTPGVVGIVETYKDATEIIGDIRRTQAIIWTIGGGMGALLYLALAAVVWQASASEERAIARLERQNRELTLLQQLTQSLLRPLDLSEVAARVAESAAAAVGLSRATLYRVHDGSLVPLAGWPAAAVETAPERALVDEALALRRAVVRRETLVVPMATAGGVAYLFEGRALTAAAAADIAGARTLDIVLQEAAIALDNVVMVAEIRSAHERMAAILSGITDQMVIVDTEMRVVWQNAAAAAAGQRDIGRPCFEMPGIGDEACAGCPAMRSLHSGGVERGVMARPQPGGEVRYLDLVTAPLRDASGRVYQVLEVARDITELVQMEERLKQANQALVDTQTRLVEKERLAAVGEIVVALHHSIFNPLTGILGALQVIRNAEPGGPELAQAVAEAEAEARKIEQLIRRLADLRTATGTAYVGATKMLDLQADTDTGS